MHYPNLLLMQIKIAVRKLYLNYTCLISILSVCEVSSNGDCLIISKIGCLVPQQANWAQQDVSSENVPACTDLVFI